MYGNTYIPAKMGSMATKMMWQMNSFIVGQNPTNGEDWVEIYETVRSSFIQKYFQSNNNLAWFCLNTPVYTINSLSIVTKLS